MSEPDNLVTPSSSWPVATPSSWPVASNWGPALSASAMPLNPAELVARAVLQGAGVDTLERLIGLQERWERTQARKAFDSAMAAARAQIPVVIKNKEVDFHSAKGRTHYKYADLAEVMRTVDPILAEHGLYPRFQVSTTPEQVMVTCFISHRDGYSTENTISGPVDLSGNKNPIQAIGSAITYFQRYALMASLGLAAAADDDAQGVNVGNGTVTDEQAQYLLDKIHESGADEEKLYRYAGVTHVSQIKVGTGKGAYDDLLNFLALRKKREAKS